MHSVTLDSHIYVTARFKTFDSLPSRSTGFKTGQLILSHTWLFRNSACERFVRRAEGTIFRAAARTSGGKVD